MPEAVVAMAAAVAFTAVVAFMAAASSMAEAFVVDASTSAAGTSAEDTLVAIARSLRDIMSISVNAILNVGYVWRRHHDCCFDYLGPLFYPFDFYDIYDYAFLGYPFDDAFWDYG